MDPDYFLMEEMDSPRFQVVKMSGEIIGNLDILAAEGFEYRIRKNGQQLRWVDRGDLKERKRVRKLISEFKAKTTSVVQPHYFVDARL